MWGGTKPSAHYFSVIQMTYPKEGFLAVKTTLGMTGGVFVKTLNRPSAGASPRM